MSIALWLPFCQSTYIWVENAFFYLRCQYNRYVWFCNRSNPILSNAHTVRGRPTLTNHIDSYISNNLSKKCQIRSSRTLEQHHTLLYFSYTHEFWRSKANWRFRFTLLPIILADLLGNTRFLRRVEKVMTCDFRSALWGSVSRFVACDRNDD